MTISSDIPEYQDKLHALPSNFQSLSLLCTATKAIDNAFQKDCSGIDENAKFLKSINNTKGVEISAPEDTANTITPLSTSVSYNATRAKQYANLKGFDYNTLIFKRMSADCTNFVSQCLWVGYGGDQGNNWYSDSGVSNCRQLAYNNYRQIGGSSGWWGVSQISSGTLASSSWRAVQNLWNYLSTSSSGPRANKYYNLKYFDSTANMVVRPGDILQFGVNNSGTITYKHSVMVVDGNVALTNTDNIYVGQHSDDNGYRQLTNLLNANQTYDYIRVIRPITGSFNS